MPYTYLTIHSIACHWLTFCVKYIYVVSAPLNFALHLDNTFLLTHEFNHLFLIVLKYLLDWYLLIPASKVSDFVARPFCLLLLIFLASSSILWPHRQWNFL